MIGLGAALHSLASVLPLRHSDTSITEAYYNYNRTTGMSAVDTRPLRRHCGKILLVLRITAFDPNRRSAAPLLL